MTSNIKPYKEDKAFSTGFAHQDRLSLFAPFTHIDPKFHASKKNKVGRQTSFGSVVYEYGLLDQTHRDILQVLFSKPDDFNMEVILDSKNKTTIEFSFTLYKLLKALKCDVRNYEWILKKLWEMKVFSFTLIPSKNEELLKFFNYGKVFTSVLNSVNLPDNENFHHEHVKIEINAYFFQCWLYDTAIHTERLTDEILETPLAYNKALIHHCMTHQKVNRLLSEVMIDIGLPDKQINPKGFSKYKLKIISPDNIKWLYEIFKIQIVYNETTKEWYVFYNQKDLGGKVWTDNELNQYSRVSSSKQIEFKNNKIKRSNVKFVTTQQRLRYKELLNKSTNRLRLSSKEDEELFKLKQLFSKVV